MFLFILFKVTGKVEETDLFSSDKENDFKGSSVGYSSESSSRE